MILYFYFSDKLQLQLARPHQLGMKPSTQDHEFGKYFTDHMLRIKWTEANGWGSPFICHLQNIDIHPASKVSTFSNFSCMFLNSNIFFPI